MVNLMISCLAGVIAAYQAAWIIGDDFLCEMYSTLTNIKNKASLNRCSPPYLYDFYNVYGYFQNRSSMVRGVVHIFNAFVEGINNHTRLPMYSVFIPDIDILKHIGADVEGYTGDDIPHCIDWLLRNIEKYTSRREFELFNKRPGALMVDYPKFVWVKILKRPEDLIKSFPMFGLCNKWNNTLEAMLANGRSRYQHLILSIDVGNDSFDNFGQLTNSGKEHFWHELNSCMKKVRNETDKP